MNPTQVRLCTANETDPHDTKGFSCWDKVEQPSQNDCKSHYDVGIYHYVHIYWQEIKNCRRARLGLCWEYRIARRWLYPSLRSLPTTAKYISRINNYIRTRTPHTTFSYCNGRMAFILRHGSPDLRPAPFGQLPVKYPHVLIDVLPAPRTWTKRQNHECVIKSDDMPHLAQRGVRIDRVEHTSQRKRRLTPR